MKISFAIIFLSVGFVGCDLSRLGSADEDEEEEREVIATGERWWEEGYEAPDDDQAGSDDPSGATNDTGAPDTDEDQLEDSFEIELNLETGEGSFGVDSPDCRLRGEIVEGTEVTPCADCSLARSMKIGSVSIEEASGCGEFMSSGSGTMTYGHGTEELFEFEGVKLHALYEQVDGEWSLVDDGFSIVIDTTWIVSIDLAE